jgi:hypothetical protein
LDLLAPGNTVTIVLMSALILAFALLRARATREANIGTSEALPEAGAGDLRLALVTAAALVAVHLATQAVAALGVPMPLNFTHLALIAAVALTALGVMRD